MNAEVLARLPLFLHELLDSCPAAGDGVHYWIFRVARHLLAHFDDQITFELIKAKARGCGRPIGKLEREIITQIRGAHACAWHPKYPAAFPQCNSTPIVASPPAPTWPEPDEENIRRIVQSNFGLVDLQTLSLIQFDNEASHAEEICDALFPGNPLLCIGRSSYRFAIRRREVWRGHLHRLPLIVPSPMLDYIGITTEGRLSEHSLDNVGRRTYLVVEFDFSEFGRDGKTLSRWAPLVRDWQAQGITIADACAALHFHLSDFGGLACITSSGGKSLHGWYRAYGRCEGALRYFMERAVSLGADRATWTRSQFVRIPDGQRENGQVQRCFYLNPQEAIRL